MVQYHPAMFRDGKKPALVVPAKRLSALIAMLRRAGYAPHVGRRVIRKDERLALRKAFRVRGQGRQCHVQILCDGDHQAPVCLFAHTEPDSGDTATMKDVVKHGIAALTGRVSYAAGARMLMRDLKRAGYRSGIR